MRETGGKINGAREIPQPGTGTFAVSPHMTVMNYVLALFLPPLSILFTGRLILSIVVFLIWVPAILISGGLGHPIFILLAWLLIYQSHADRREDG